MDELQKLRDNRRVALESAKALTDAATAESRELTDEEETRIDAFLAESKQLETEIATAEAKLKAKQEKQAAVAAAYSSLTVPQPRIVPSPIANHPTPPQIEVLDTANLFSLRGISRIQPLAGLTREQTHSLYYAAGQWTRAVIFNSLRIADPRPARWCAEHGLDLFAVNHIEKTDYLGGYLVPSPIEDGIIILREEYGLFRRLARNVMMTSDTSSRRRQTGGLTAYFVGEAGAGTTSNATFDFINLTAKKLMVLTTLSSELNEDSVVALGEHMSREIAYAFASKEDDCGFNGDGTSTYGKILGVINRLDNVGTAGRKSLTSGSSTAWSSITLRDMGAIVGLLPEFARNQNNRWVCSSAFFGNVMMALDYAGGGNNKADIQGGVSRSFLGYPVEISQKLPTAADTAELVVLFGDFSMACDFGDRRGTTIDFSRDAYVNSESAFEKDFIAVRGTERFDINVHDVGSSTAAGPVVAGLSAA